MQTRLRVILIALALLTGATGCISPGVNNSCTDFRPIVLTGKDIDIISDDAIDQILRHNEKHNAICGFHP